MRSYWLRASETYKLFKATSGRLFDGFPTLKVCHLSFWCLLGPLY